MRTPSEVGIMLKQSRGNAAHMWCRHAAAAHCPIHVCRAGLGRRDCRACRHEIGFHAAVASWTETTVYGEFTDLVRSIVLNVADGERVLGHAWRPDRSGALPSVAAAYNVGLTKIPDLAIQLARLRVCPCLESASAVAAAQTDDLGTRGTAGGGIVQEIHGVAQPGILPSACTGPDFRSAD